MTNQYDKAWQNYSERFRAEVLPKILDSKVFLSIGSEVGNFDVRQATEVGAALLMDKPVILIVPAGRHISERLRRCADIVIDDWDPSDVHSQERIRAALKEIEAA